jgi:hypothetical protein
MTICGDCAAKEARESVMNDDFWQVDTVEITDSQPDEPGTLMVNVTVKLTVGFPVWVHECTAGNQCILCKKEV